MSPYEILDSDDNPQPDNIHVEIHVDLANFLPGTFVMIGWRDQTQNFGSREAQKSMHFLKKLSISFVIKSTSS